MNQSKVTLICILVLVFCTSVALVCISVVLGLPPSPHQVHLWLFMQETIFSPSTAKGSSVHSSSGMLGCGGHSKFGITDAIRWLPGEISVLATASLICFVLGCEGH